VDVVRHPYSFKGGHDETENQIMKDNSTWTWHDGLNTYAGDDLERSLLQSGLYMDVVHDLRSPGGLQRALDKPDIGVLKTLERLSLAKGYSVQWTVDNLQKLLQNIPPPSKGDSASHARGRKQEGSELDAIAGNEFRRMLQGIGSDAGIQFNYNANFQWYPVDSQRVLLYARQFGASEAYADALARRHFTKAMPSGSRDTVVDAAEEVGLDAEAVKEMLQGDDYTQQVLQSYYETIAKHNIRSIPNFTFNGPKTSGGKFRPGGVRSGEITIAGSGNVGQFLAVFEHIRDTQLEEL